MVVGEALNLTFYEQPGWKKTSISWFVIHWSLGRHLDEGCNEFWKLATCVLGNLQNVLLLLLGRHLQNRSRHFVDGFFIRYPNSHDVMGLAVSPQELSELELLQPQ